MIKRTSEIADGEKYGASSYVGPGIWQGTLDEFETFSGRYEGRGIPVSRNAGAHYDAKWNRGKSSINMNYRAGSLDVDGLTNTVNENILPTTRVINSFNQSNNNSIARQRFDVNFRTQLDSTSSIQILSETSLRNTNTQSINNDSGLRDNSTYQYLNTRSLTNDAEQRGFNIRASWGKRLKKPRRTLSLSGNYSYNQDNRDGYLNTVNNFYDNTGIMDSIQRIDQYRTSNSKTAALTGSIAWSEPVSKTISATANYSIAANSTLTDRESFNKSAMDTYIIPEPLYTNDLHFDMLSNQAQVGANYQKNKSTLNVSAGMATSRYKQNDKFLNAQFDRSFINWNPQAQYSYRISPQKSFSFRYGGNTTQPGVIQIQSLRVNDDPLNVTIGNPNLEPSFTNSFFMTYSSYKVLTNLSFSMYAGYSIISNLITTSNIIDEAGKRTLQWVNADRTTPALSSNISLSKKLKSGLQLRTSVLLYKRHEYNLINGSLNKIGRDSYSFAFSASKSKLKKYNYSLSINPTYWANAQSFQNTLNDDRWGIYSSASFTGYLPGKTEISSNASYQFNERTQSFGQTVNPFILNSSISKRFLKSESLKLSVSGSDIFKQNLGFSRGAFSQTSYNVIQRYYMLSLTWDFSKMGAAKQ